MKLLPFLLPSCITAEFACRGHCCTLDPGVRGSSLPSELASLSLLRGTRKGRDSPSHISESAGALCAWS